MRLLIKLALVAGFAGAGYLGWGMLRGSQFGMSGAHPLGTFEKMDTYIAQDVGLLKEKISRVYVPDIRPTAAMYEYTNPRNKYESIILLLDEDHTVQGVIGTYYQGDTGSRSPVKLFVQGLWRLTGGAREPVFTEIEVGRYTVRSADFVKRGVRGGWEIYEEEGQKSERIYLRSLSE